MTKEEEASELIEAPAYSFLPIDPIVGEQCDDSIAFGR